MLVDLRGHLDRQEEANELRRLEKARLAVGRDAAVAERVRRPATASAVGGLLDDMRLGRKA